jgi:co-chaperonin GroES (HSP10)
MSYKKLQLVGTNVLVAPSVSRSRGMIAIPDTVTDGATACIVLKAGNKANPLIKEGDTVMVMNGIGARGRNFLPNIGKNFLVSDTEVYAVFRKGAIIPLGRTVLIKRDIQSINHGSIFIPEKLRAQSLTGEVIRLGLTREPFRSAFDLRPGMKIMLEEWKPEMVEVQLEDGSFGLIVNEKDILYYEQ